MEVSPTRPPKIRTSKYDAIMNLVRDNPAQWVAVHLVDVPGKTKSDKQTSILQAARNCGLHDGENQVQTATSGDRLYIMFSSRRAPTPLIGMVGVVPSVT